MAFAFFAFALGGAVLFLHPVLTPVSLIAAISYAVWLLGRRAVRFALLALIPLTLVAATFNPLFSHAGVTILGYLPGGNPLTLESVVYGGFAAVMIATAIAWFMSSNQVLT
ncbi:MAG: hypothetical protein LBG60_03990, partial [Bifidobacteriaceae bacterium]|nr:hypothetical protein [Bifidobacteriaceae bacterium]